MKPFKQFFAAFVAAFVAAGMSFSVNASGISPEEAFRLVVTPVKANSKAMVRVAQIPSADLKIVMMDADGVVISTRYAKAGEPFAKLFSFERMHPGNYSISAVSGNQEYRQRISIDNQGRVETLGSSAFSGPQPVVVQKDAKVKIKLTNHFQDKVRVILYNERGQEVYRAAKYDEEVSKKLNLSKLPKGNYMLEVHKGARFVSQDVALW